MTKNINIRQANGISWQEAGNGELLLFLHAMAGSRTAWSPQFSMFSSTYRCVAWDMPGFGESETLPPSARMGDVVDLLRNFIVRDLKVTSCHIVGLSVGGMILQNFAAKYPELVKSAVIVDSSPKFGLGGDMKPAEFVDPICQDLKSCSSIDGFCDNMIRSIVGPACSEAVKIDAIDAMMRATASGLMLTTKLIGQHDALDVLKDIRARTFVMVGENDGETPVAYSEALASKIKDAELSVIRNAGHLSNLENALQFNNDLQNFLRPNS